MKRLNEPASLADMIGSLLDAASLAVTAGTGHPGAAAASFVLGQLAKHHGASLLAHQATMFREILPAMDKDVAVRAGRRWINKPVAELLPGDRIRVPAMAVVPADALCVAGGPPKHVLAGTYACPRAWELIVERPAAASRVERLRRHVRHALQSREAPGPLTPDLERILALPLTAAGLVLALTKDAGRAASLLQADPGKGLALAQPIAREAALYALARQGILLTGLDAMDRLARADVIAFQDIGILAPPLWQLTHVAVTQADADPHVVVRWLGALLGRNPREAALAGYPDEAVAAWREHGAVLKDGKRVLHVAGAAKMQSIWGIRLPEPDRSVLVRRLGIVLDGRLVAIVHLTAQPVPDIGPAFAGLRKLGVKHIAIFTEDHAETPPPALRALDKHAEILSDRTAQREWLHQAASGGHRVALVHSTLRDLLPVGGLSLCPAEAEAGAHGVFLGDPLHCLVRGRALAMDLRQRLRVAFGVNVAIDAATMFAAGLRMTPPIVTAGLRHAATFGLLSASAALSRTTLPSHSSTTTKGDTA